MAASSNWWPSALLFALTIFLWAYFKIKSIYSYFERLGMPYVKPTFLLGSDVRGALGRDGIPVIFDRLYKALDGKKVGGCFLGIIPTVFVREPDYVNKVLTTYFDHFYDRTFLIDEETNPTEGHMFFLKGKKWRYIRHHMSPAFTPSKLKYMYAEISKCSDILTDHMGGLANGKDIDLNDTLANFTTDVIGTTAFGLEPECLKNPKSKFREMGRRFFASTFRNTIIFFLRLAAPRFLIAMKIRTTEREVSDYFMSLFKQVFDYRRKKSVTRNDFIQLSLELKEKGYIETEGSEIDDQLSTSYNDKTIEAIEITDEVLAAQSFVFYAAGYETTSKALYFLIYLLSLHKEVQDKAREEVRRAKLKYKEFSYEFLKELSYLDNCISEAMRIYPPLPVVIRECTKDFAFPDGTRIEKGVQIAIPIFSLHRDPKYFPEPEVFKPERFEKPPIQGSYAPFGDGPRMCIGKRFALMVIKMATAQLLDRFYFEKSSLTITPIEFQTFVILDTVSPLWVKIIKCEQ